MPGDQGLIALLGRFFRRRGPKTPAESWLARREKAGPEEVIQEHFAAINAHDLEWILATLAPERVRLYSKPGTVDQRRQTISEAKVLGIAPADVSLELPAFAQRYRTVRVYKVDYDLKLVELEERRDPSLQEGSQWTYFVLVNESGGKPWLIADWGR